MEFVFGMIFGTVCWWMFLFAWDKIKTRRRGYAQLEARCIGVSQLEALERWVESQRYEAKKQDRRAVGAEFERFVELLKRITDIETAVWGNEPPASIVLEKIEFIGGTDVFVLKSQCRKAEIKFYLNSGIATLVGDPDNSLLDVTFDLTKEIPAKQVDQLLGYFRAKRVLAESGR